MRSWKRAHMPQACGGCTTLTPQGGVFLVIENSGGKRARCAACARRLFGEEAPEDLPQDAPGSPPANVVLLSQPSAFVPSKALAAAVAADFKVRQLGERE